VSEATAVREIYIKWGGNGGHGGDGGNGGRRQRRRWWQRLRLLLLLLLLLLLWRWLWRLRRQRHDVRQEGGQGGAGGVITLMV
jgi:hypothetical protein